MMASQSTGEENILNLDETIIEAPDDKCKVCKEDVLEGQRALLCDNCNKWVHEKCLPSDQKYAEEKRKLLWLCSNLCRKDSYYTEEISDIDIKTAKTPEIIACLVQLLKQNNSVIKLMGNQKKENSKMTSEMKKLRLDCDESQKEIRYLKTELGNIKQAQLNMKSICYGIPDSAEEEPKEAITNYFRGKNLNIDSIETIKECYKLKPSKNGKSTPIVCVFHNNKEKTKFIKQTNGEIKTYNNNGNAKIIVKAKEMLCKEKYQLLQEVWAVFKDFNFKWTKNGQIMVKKSTKEEDKIVFINSSEDIANYFLSLES